MANTRDFTAGSPMKLLLSFSLPLMFSNVFQQLYTVVDTAIIGQGVGMTALAAVGTVDWLNWMFLGITQGFTQGFSVQISQKFGKQDWEGVKEAMGVSAVLSVILAVVCTLVGQLGIPAFLHLLQVPQELQGNALIYARYILGGFSLSLLFNYCASALRAVGDSKTPLYAMVASSLLNIVLDFVAVFWLKWGIAGAAIATLISQLLAGIICLVQMMKTPVLRFGKKHMRMEKALVGKLLQLGSPLAAKNIIIAVSGMSVQSVVNSFDVSFIAGFTATNKLYGILEIAASSYGYAVTTFMGQNYGAMRTDRIKKGMSSATGLFLATSVLIAAIMILFGRPITMLFISKESAALAAAAGQTAYTYLLTMSVVLPVLYLLYLYMSALQGIGNTVVPMIAGIMELAMRVCVALIVTFTGIQNLIFAAECSSWAASALLMGICWRSNIKKLLKSTQQQEALQ